MIDRIFLDTNLFVYAVDDSGSGKGTVARDVILESLQKKIGVVSHQVIQEFVNVTTYKFKQPISQKNCVCFWKPISIQCGKNYQQKSFSTRACEFKIATNFPTTMRRSWHPLYKPSAKSSTPKTCSTIKKLMA